MRRVLDGLYRATGAAAALSVAAIGAVVLVQVGLGAVGRAVGWLTGTPVGLVLPSYAEFAGFFFAAASFLALASTFRAGGHIRVTVLIRRLPEGGAARRWVELWCLAAAAVVAGFLAFHAAVLAWESFAFGDVSPGLVPVPLWLPQAAMVVGAATLTIALLDAAVVGVLRRRGAGPLPVADARPPSAGAAAGHAAAEGRGESAPPAEGGRRAAA